MHVKGLEQCPVPVTAMSGNKWALASGPPVCGGRVSLHSIIVRIKVSHVDAEKNAFHRQVLRKRSFPYFVCHSPINDSCVVSSWPVLLGSCKVLGDKQSIKLAPNQLTGYFEEKNKS